MVMIIVRSNFVCGMVPTCLFEEGLMVEGRLGRNRVCVTLYISFTMLYRIRIN